MSGEDTCHGINYGLNNEKETLSRFNKLKLNTIVKQIETKLKKMGHNITAIILKDDYDKTIAESFGLIGIELPFSLTLFHIDHYQTACWQYELKTVGQIETSISDNFIFPNEIAISEVVKTISFNEKPLLPWQVSSPDTTN